MTICRMSCLRHRVDHVRREEVEERLDERLRLREARLARGREREVEARLHEFAKTRPITSAIVVATSK